MKLAALDGLLVLDKPAGMTSRAAVDRIVRLFPRSTRIGHTGTLDPLATGVLVLCIGSATRFTEYVQDMAKTYLTTLVLGARSATDDGEGPITPAEVEIPPERGRIDHEILSFVGAIDQVPPDYSAAKVTGRRAYDLARQGLEVTLQPRRVHITAIDILDYAYPRLSLEVHCGKGTYIRALARDLGERLGCGAYIETLRRTRVGPFTEAKAIPPEAELALVRDHLLPLDAALSELPRVTLNPEEVIAVRHGRGVPCPQGGVQGKICNDRDIAMFDTSGKLIGVARADIALKILLPSKVMPERGIGAM